MKHDLGYKGTLLEMMNWITVYWSAKVIDFIFKLFKKSDWTSKDRQRPTINAFLMKP